MLQLYCYITIIFLNVQSLLLQMTYECQFVVDYGLPARGKRSLGYEKDPHQTRETHGVQANCDDEAVKKAVKLAENLALNYPTNPKTGRTTVKISSLKNSRGDITDLLDEKSISMGSAEKSCIDSKIARSLRETN